MFKLNSVKSRIAIQIAVVVAPFALMLIYQSSAGHLRAGEIERAFALSSFANQAQRHFRSFKNAAADAVDSGHLNISSTEALAATQADLAHFLEQQEDEALRALKGKVEAMFETLRRNSSSTGFAAVRADLGAVDQAINSLQSKYAEANDATINSFIEAAHRQTWIMLGIVALTTAIVMFSVLWMMGWISAPLARAQLVAEEIGSGKLYLEPGWAREKDLGGLLNSLGVMNNGLRDIVSRTKQAVEIAQTAARNASQQMHVVREVGNQQSGWVNVTRVSLSEMNASIANVTAGASTTLVIAERVQSVARQGSEKMAENQHATQRIIETVDNSATAINALSNSIARIADVTNMIKDIADQTNLLALNAAIEAARAGEQGRGFAVVADEVRKLAERTTTRTTDIASMVQTINNETAQVVQAMASAKQEVQLGAEQSRSTGECLTQIVTAAEEVLVAAQKINQIAAAQQSSATQAIENMDQIARLTELGAGKVSEAERGVEGLQQTATQLSETIGRFNIA